MADFYTILTNVGLAKINAAVANNENLILKDFAVGDGNGIYVTPTANQTKLVNERYRSLISSVLIHAENTNWLEIICIIPTEIGGFTIREVGLFDEDGDLIAVTKHPATYKPLVAEGTAKELFIKNIIAVENTSNVSISFDNSSVYITKEYVDKGDSKKVDKVAGKGLSDTNFTASEKDKLEDIDPGANNYSLPNATGSVKGGVLVGTNIDVSNGSISIKNASTTEKGVVQLNDTTTSSLTTVAATARSVKEVADNLQTASDGLGVVNTTLADFAKEVTLTPLEKLSVWRTWLTVVEEKAILLAQADTFEIDTTAYVTAYNSYDSYLYGTTGVLKDMTRNNKITPDIFQSKLTNYNNAKVSLLKALTDKLDTTIQDLADFNTTRHNTLSQRLEHLIEGTWQTPVLLSGFTANGVCRYKKTKNTLIIDMSVNGTTQGLSNPIFSLPAEYRPIAAKNPIFATIGGNATAVRGFVGPTGEVGVSTATSITGTFTGFTLQATIRLD